MADNRRKHIRFTPDDKTYMFFQIEHSDTEYTHAGLAVSESQGGASGVFLNNAEIVAGKMCLLKIGKLETMSAEIRRVTELDEDVVKVGFKLLE